MTNLGFHRLMAEHEIEVVVTDVGDRYVLEALRERDGLLGGEQSGHIIYLRGHVTGDGLAAALLLCGALKGRTLHEAAAVMPRYPQVRRTSRSPRSHFLQLCSTRSGEPIRNWAERAAFSSVRPGPNRSYGS